MNEEEDASFRVHRYIIFISAVRGIDLVLFSELSQEMSLRSGRQAIATRSMELDASGVEISMSDGVAALGDVISHPYQFLK